MVGEAHDVLSEIRDTMSVKIGSETRGGGNVDVTVGDAYGRAYNYETNTGFKGIENLDDFGHMLKVGNSPTPKGLFSIVSAMENSFGDISDLTAKQIDFKRKVNFKNINKTSKLNNFLIKNKLGTKQSLMKSGSLMKLGGMIGAGFLLTQAMHPSATMDIDGMRSGIGSEQFELQSKQNEYNKRQYAKTHKLRLFNLDKTMGVKKNTDLESLYFS
jgi:hypothetical protein